MKYVHALGICVIDVVVVITKYALMNDYVIHELTLILLFNVLLIRRMYVVPPSAPCAYPYL